MMSGHETCKQRTPGVPLENRRHEAFAQELAKGTASAEAYMKVYPSSNKRAARAHASRMVANGNTFISDRIRELQQASASEVVLTMRERREFLARVVRANLSDFDMDRDGDLIQELTENSSSGSTTKRLRLPDKIACIMEDAKLAGELPTKIHISGEVEAKIKLPEDLRLAIIEKRRIALAAANATRQAMMN